MLLTKDVDTKKWNVLNPLSPNAKKSSHKMKGVGLKGHQIIISALHVACNRWLLTVADILKKKKKK